MKHEGEARAEKEEGKENEEKRKGEDEEGDMEEGRKRISDLLAERGEKSRPQWHTGVPSAHVLSKIPPYFQP